MRNLLLAAIAALAVGMTPAASAVSWDEGHWRLELSAGPGVDSGSIDRSDDIFASVMLDREMPMGKRSTLSLRLMPLYVYTQGGDDEDNDRLWQKVHHHFHGDEYDDDTVVGAGFGGGVRLYQRAETFDGLFLEASLMAAPHVGLINGNSVNIDFLSGAGVGYKFSNRWHAILKFEHLSNAGFGDDNKGTNAVRLGVGYSF